MDPGKAAFHGGFEVPGETAVTAKPPKGSFNDPAPRKHLERRGRHVRNGSFRRPSFGIAFVGALEDLQGDARPAMNDLHTFPSEAAVAPDQRKSRVPSFSFGDDQRAAIPLLDQAGTRPPQLG